MSPLWPAVGPAVLVPIVRRRSSLYGHGAVLLEGSMTWPTLQGQRRTKADIWRLPSHADTWKWCYDPHWLRAYDDDEDIHWRERIFFLSCFQCKCAHTCYSQTYLYDLKFAHECIYTVECCFCSRCKVKTCGKCCCWFCCWQSLSASTTPLSSRCKFNNNLLSLFTVITTHHMYILVGTVAGKLTNLPTRSCYSVSACAVEISHLGIIDNNCLTHRTRSNAVICFAAYTMPAINVFYVGPITSDRRFFFSLCRPTDWLTVTRSPDYGRLTVSECLIGDMPIRRSDCLVAP